MNCFNYCARPTCFAPRAFGSKLCVKCNENRISAIVLGICFGLMALVLGMAKLWRLI